jgi:hypothetical protein
LTHAVTFEEALEIIYETIGCSDVCRKPNLSYKLVSAPQKAEPITLGSADDWRGCLEDVAQVQAKKKSTVQVKIIVGEQVCHLHSSAPFGWLICCPQYMMSLRAKSKSGKGTSSKKGGRLGKKPMAILDLDNSDDGDDEDDDGSMEKEKRSLEQLQMALNKCQCCGPTKSCKIGKDGQHVTLSFNQLRGWAMALVFPCYLVIVYGYSFFPSQAIGTRGVTLHTPPKGDLFAAFHSDSSLTATSTHASTPVHGPTPFAPGSTPGMFNPYAFMTPPLWMMQAGMPSYPPTPTPRHLNIPSSDPPDDSGANPYPEIRLFFEKLDQQHPRRQLLPYVDEFEKKDFYHIDEITKISTECLTGVEFHLSAGNAQFIVDAAKAEMKRIDRSLGKRWR